MRIGNLKRLGAKARSIKRTVLDICFASHTGHIGPALSVADILTVLYFGVLKKNDHFILSKGHAASALYATLYERGIISKKILFSYCHDGGRLGTHPDRNLRLGIELTTGSLGHGLSVGVGMALGTGDNGRVFVLVSDAELNEGSVWESVMFAGHHGISNLTVIVDDNGQQAFGKTKDVLNLRPITDKFKAFGWGVKSVDGHDLPALMKVLSKVPITKGMPTAIIARTIAGKGVAFMEGKVEWHYLPLDETLYKRALKGL